MKSDNGWQWLAAAFLAALIIVVLRVPHACGDDWVLYAASGQKFDIGNAVRDYYELNKLRPLDEQNSGTTRHYYDRDSIGRNSPFGGGTVRVWEKAVILESRPAYKSARESVEKEERALLKRQLTVLDTTWILNMTANRAAQAIETYYEINCDTDEFFVMEVNTYDTNGLRMTREVISDKYLWSKVNPGSIMQILAQKTCEPPSDDQ